MKPYGSCENRIRASVGVAAAASVASVPVALFTRPLYGFCLAGLGGLAAFFLVMNACGKAAADAETPAGDAFDALYRAYEEDSDGFVRAFRSFCRLASFYRFWLMILVLLSLTGLLSTGVAVSLNTGSDSGGYMGGFGLFVAGLLGVFVTVFRSFFWRNPAEGDDIPRLEPDAHPEFYRVLHRAAARAGTGIPDTVFLDPTNNFGIREEGAAFRSPRTVLTVGVFPLCYLTEPELESVLIHEFAHTKDPHVRLGMRHARNTALWARIAQHCHNKSLRILVLGRFAEYYALKSELMCRVLSQANEYRADAAAAEAAPADFAKALLKLGIFSLYADLPNHETGYDPRRFEEPPADYFDAVLADFRAMWPAHAQDWRSKTLKRIHSKSDTHPCLSDRLKRLGLEAPPAEDLDFAPPLSEEIAKVLVAANEKTRRALSENWEQTRSAYLEGLEAENADPGDDPEARIGHALTLHGAGRSDRALAILEELAAENSHADFFRGMILLERDDPAGVEPVRRGVEEDPNFIGLGLSILSEYFDRNGLKEEKEALTTWAREKEKTASELERELQYISPDDEFLSPELSEEARRRLTEKLAEVASIRQFYLAVKPLKILGKPMWVALVTSRVSPKDAMSNRWLKDVDRIEAILTEEGLEPCFITAANQAPAVLAKISKIPETRILRR